MTETPTDPNENIHDTFALAAKIREFVKSQDQNEALGPYEIYEAMIIATQGLIGVMDTANYISSTAPKNSKP